MGKFLGTLQTVWSLLMEQPWAFAALAFALLAIGWTAGRFMFGERMANLKDRLQRRDETIADLQRRVAQQASRPVQVNPLDHVPLSEDEIETIRKELSNLDRQQVSLYNVHHGKALAESLEVLFSPVVLGWDVKFERTDMRISAGVTLYPKDETTQRIGEAIRKATRGRIKPKYEVTNNFWFGRAGDYPNDLVLGRMNISIGEMA